MVKQSEDFCKYAYMVAFLTLFMLRKGSSLSGQRRTHGVNTMANELEDMRL